VLSGFSVEALDLVDNLPESGSLGARRGFVRKKLVGTLREIDRVVREIVA
jgi:hypothetical protein